MTAFDKNLIEKMNTQGTKMQGNPFDKQYKKIVLAYSGGLDTTVAIPWLEEKTGAEVIALGVDVGQPGDFSGAVKKALAAGAINAGFTDVKREFVEHFVFPCIRANGLYEGVYPLISTLSRPLIAGLLVSEARASGADAVAHGCTGKGNDQVRFEMALAALAPDLHVLAPARHWGFTRDDSRNYAAARNIPVDAGPGTPYSIDENLWGRAVECGVLDDAWQTPPEDAFELTKSPLEAPDTPETMIIDFEEGKPVALDGKALDPLTLVETVGARAGKHGVGRIDHVESRVVGIKSREIYEAPAAMPLIEAHKALEAMVLTRDELAFKAHVDASWSQLAYEGKWFSPLMEGLGAFIDKTQTRVTGSVKLTLFKGGMAVAGRKSPHSLYHEELATYGAADPFDHAAAEGFLKIFTLETSTLACMAKAREEYANQAGKAGKDDHAPLGLEQPVC